LRTREKFAASKQVSPVSTGKVKSTKTKNQNRERGKLGMTAGSIMNLKIQKKDEPNDALPPREGK